MKNLIFISGTMGVGKTTVGQILKKNLNHCVFLDGDWCWDASPFVVTKQTKEMVTDNIAHLLNNFLARPEYENIVFVWVMHEQNIIDTLISMIKDTEYSFYHFSLVSSPDILKKRLEISNNRAENSIRPFVMGRKNWLFSNTPNGAKASAIFYSLIVSAKENGLVPYEYLAKVFAEAPNGANLENLMPWN